MKHADTCELHYDRELGECTCGVAEVAALRVRVAVLERSLLDLLAACEYVVASPVPADARDRFRKACSISRENLAHPVRR